MKESYLEAKLYLFEKRLKKEHVKSYRNVINNTYKQNLVRLGDIKDLIKEWKDNFVDEEEIN
jgi:hypothetical protein